MFITLMKIKCKANINKVEYNTEKESIKKV